MPPACVNNPRRAEAGASASADNTAAGRRGIITGTSVSSGIAIGRSQFINRRGQTIVPRRQIFAEDVEAELIRLEQAVAGLVAEFSEARKRVVHEAREQGEILDAYIMICRDPKLLRAARENIGGKKMAAGWAWEKAVEETLNAFRDIDSPYLRERAGDLRAVASRVQARLQGPAQSELTCADSQSGFCLPGTAQPKIYFAHDLTPADTMALAPEKIIALATEMGGKTSHTGILARSLHIPCVVGCTGLENYVRDGELVIVDGIKGCIVVNPHEDELAEYIALQNQFLEYEEHIRERALFPAETEDGVRVAVYGNVESSHEAAALKRLGGEGIGLYRTEFGFLSRQDLPTEPELFDDYRRIISDMAPDIVILRTLDAGADKMIGTRQRLEEDNPALGLRAIRYCMRHQDIFRRQLRAMLRASVYGNAAIMFPMISGLDELRLAKSILSEAKQELDNEGIPYDPNIKLGTMIELPAAVLVAKELAREVDFFSIGTNDLIQYSLGIDRGNKYVAYLFQPLHPAIIQAIKHVVDMAHQEGISVGVCGEMAADPYCIPVLLGMGIDELSMTPPLIPFVKSLIRRSNTEEFRALVRQLYTHGSSETIIRLIRQSVYTRFEDELTFFASMTGVNI